MLSCCYDCKNKSYRYYGEKGVTVCKRWHNFQTFCEDIKNLPGYEEWKNSDFLYALDKDILCDKKDIIPKIYSKDTCQFIEISENSRLSEKRSTGLVYEAKRLKDNYIENFKNIAEFSRKYNLNTGSINGCLIGKFRQTKGWSFKVIRQLP